jgi:hypothetical protein
MSNLSRVLSLVFPEELTKIRTAAPLIARCSDLEVERAWFMFSNDLCAKQLIVGAETLKQFNEWLTE